MIRWILALLRLTAWPTPAPPRIPVDNPTPPPDRPLVRPGSREFEVRARFPFGDDWQEMDAAVRAAAGCLGGFSGASACERDHGWIVPTLADAVAMRERLAAVPGVTATVRETTTEPPPPVVMIVPRCPACGGLTRCGCKGGAV